VCDVINLCLDVKCNVILWFRVSLGIKIEAELVGFPDLVEVHFVDGRRLAVSLLLGRSVEQKVFWFEIYRIWLNFMFRFFTKEKLFYIKCYNSRNGSNYFKFVICWIYHVITYQITRISYKALEFMLIHFYLIEHYLLSFILSNTFLSFWRPETLTLFRFVDLFLNPQNNDTYSTD
jgi:hypothetical protein